MVHCPHRRSRGIANEQDTAMFPQIAAHAAAACLPKLCESLWQIFNKGDGTATIKLDGPYELRLNEKNSEIKIVNSKTGEVTWIHGDPHVDYNKDGKTDFDFWGTTTFKLEDGTKISINTEPWKGNKDMYVANNIVVTKGEQSLVIDGLSQNKHGDLKIHQGLNGRQLDRMTPDGNLTLRENPNGAGWLNEKDQMVTQADGNRTKHCASKPQPPAPDFCKQLETMFHQGMQHASDTGKGKGKGSSGGWLQAMAEALGNNLHAKANEIEGLAKQVTGANPDPKIMTSLQRATQEMSFWATATSTAITTSGEALNTLARKG
jgi:hypothetical protein